MHRMQVGQQAASTTIAGCLAANGEEIETMVKVKHLGLCIVVTQPFWVSM
jgi:hypothetical protein